MNQPTKRPDAPGPRGFTLIELLVVVSVIVLLLAVLLPSLAGARDKARTTYCLSNLRQLNTAFYLYMYDNDGFTTPRYIEPQSADSAGPPNYPTRSGSNPGAYWSDQILLGQYAGSTNGDNMHPEFLGPNVSPRSPFICPCDLSHNNTNANPATLSYGMSGNFPSVKFPKYYSALRKLDPTVSPETEMEIVDSLTPLMSPGGWVEPYPFYGDKEPLINGNWLDPDPNSYYNWARRHENGANVVFLDGHASTIHDLETAYLHGELTCHRVD